jgi:acyl-CoA synthetase (AMP-forming)/AMP-acid ligase II
VSSLPSWNLADVLDAIAAEIPDSSAIISPEGTLSWSALDSQAEALAADLDALGLQRQAKVAVYLRNVPEYLVAYVAALKGSYVPVNVNYRYAADEITYLLTDSEADAVVVAAEYAPVVVAVAERVPRVRRWYVVGRVPEVLAPLVADGRVVAYGDAVQRPVAPRRHTRSGDDLLMIYTGGTTGMPKGVMWRQADLYEALMGASRAAFGLPPATCLADLLDSMERDEPLRPRGLSCSPLMHGTGLLQQFVMLLSGGTCVLLVQQPFDAEALLRYVADKRVTAMVIVGDAFGRPLVEALDRMGGEIDLSALSVISSSGALWSGDVKAALLRHLPQASLHDSLASSEGFGLGFSVTTAADLPLAAGATGRFGLGPHVRVLTDDGRFLASGEPGRGLACVAGPLPLGYYRDEAKSASTFQVIDGQRYSAPGDYVEVRPDGTVAFLGRGSACINTGGEKVFAEEVDAVLRRHADVVDAACVGIPDPRFGQRVCAVVVARAGRSLSREQLADHVKRELAGYKAPRALVLVDTLPRTPQGKVDYPAVNALAAALHASENRSQKSSAAVSS